jgi:hypothetical protein
MNIRRLTQFHEDPAIIAWWCARLGRALTWFNPARRRAALAIAAVYYGFKIPLREMEGADPLPVPSEWPGLVCTVLVLFGILWLIYRAAVNFKSLPAPVRRHPQLTLHLMYWGALAVLWVTVPAAGAWRSVLLGIAVIFPFLIWRCGYLLLAGQNGRAAGTRFADQLIVLWPAFGGTNTPYGKGLAYLSSLEAKNEDELARSQLAGIKLFILSGVLHLTYDVLGLLYGPGQTIPPLDELIAQGAQASTPQAWASIYCALFARVILLAANTHRIIGILRLFGFNVFRNTYKPLLAESVLEFWNRYYYYFKELLVAFFFLPTFIRLGGILHNWPRLRLLAAVFAAAAIGNMYYHLLHLTTQLVHGDVLDAVYVLRSRFFYCLLLAIGLYVSMARQQQRGGEPPSANRAARIRRIFGVWTFFGLISIWNKGSEPFFARVDFFLGLFGLM